MKLHFVEEMDEVLQIALEEKLPELTEETPEGLTAAVIPPAAPTSQPMAHHQ
jgi:ATP-dependent Lon protease